MVRIRLQHHEMAHAEACSGPCLCGNLHQMSSSHAVCSHELQALHEGVADQQADTSLVMQTQR